MSKAKQETVELAAIYGC